LRKICLSIKTDLSISVEIRAIDYRFEISDFRKDGFGACAGMTGKWIPEQVRNDVEWFELL